MRQMGPLYTFFAICLAEYEIQSQENCGFLACAPGRNTLVERALPDRYELFDLIILKLHCWLIVLPSPPSSQGGDTRTHATDRQPFLDGGRVQAGEMTIENQGKAQTIASGKSEEFGIIEMIYRDDVPSTGFVCSGKPEERQCSELTLGQGQRCVPYSPANNLLTHRVVLFPRELTPYGADSELLASIRQFIHQYADLSEQFEEVASYYVLLTWVYDAFRELPYLRLKGDFGSGKTRCLLTIGSLCYKPMFVSGASTVSPMFRIIDAFRGTLILDESDFRYSDEKAEIVKILNNGNAVGFPVLRSEVNANKEFNPRAFAVFGPKIIASRSGFDDKALESRCITEVLTGLPPRDDVPLTLPESFEKEAESLRNKLLSYRFSHLNLPRDFRALRRRGIDARIAQVFAPLIAVAQDSATVDRLLGLALHQSGKARAERDASIEAEILGTMVSMRRDGLSWSVKGIAEEFARRFSADYEKPITPRWMGAQLRRRLSITPIKSRGVFVIPRSAEKFVDGLFARFGLVDIGVDERDPGASVGG